MGLEPFNCLLCQKHFDRSIDLQSHIWTHCVRTLHCCSVCGKGFDKFLKAKEHTRNHTKTQDNQERNAFFEHEEEHKMNIIEIESGTHKDVKIKSEIDSDDSTNEIEEVLIKIENTPDMDTVLIKEEFAAHDRTSYATLDKLYAENACHKCPVCQEEFETVDHVKLHIISHVDKEALNCILCNKHFQTLECLEGHIWTHSQIRLFACKICGEACTKRHYLKVHIGRHMNVGPYGCTVCSKRFVTSPYLNMHMKKHYNCQPYKCAICNEGFSAKCTLNKHLKIQHNVNKPFVCEYCTNAFGTGAELREHVGVHLGESLNASYETSVDT